MSSLASLVASDGTLSRGQDGPDIKVLQAALTAAGYRVGDDGVFGLRTFQAVRQFQMQHGLTPDGRVGAITAALLDAPHATLIATAAPMVHVSGLPHDDTASLIAFYGDPDAEGYDRNMVGVTPPFPLTYAGQPWPHAIQFHGKCAPMFSDAFERIWYAAAYDPASSILARVSRFSGSYVNRPVRGSSRKSCHAFGAALDIDADDLPMGKRVDPAIVPLPVVQAFATAGLFWGNNYTGRPDPMHWQAAHE